MKQQLYTHEKQCAKCKIVKDRADFHSAKNRKDGLYAYCQSCAIADVQKKMSNPKTKAKKAEYDAQRYASQKKDILKLKKERYENSRKQLIEKSTMWAKENKEARRAISKSYKGRRRSIERCGINGVQLKNWLELQIKICNWCNANCSEKFEIDHIIPLSRGGSHEVDNLTIACPSCNRQKSNKMPEDFKAVLLKRNL